MISAASANPMQDAVFFQVLAAGHVRRWAFDTGP